MRKAGAAALLAGLFLLAAAGCTAEKNPAVASAPVTENGSSATASTAAEASAHPQVTATFTLHKDNAAFLGRIQPNAEVIALEWTGSGVLLRFRGTGLTLTMGSQETDPVYTPAVSVCADDKRAKRVSLQGIQSYTVAQGLPYGEHTLRIVKLTEVNRHPFVITSVSVSAPVGKEPLLLPPSPLPDRRILFIGDSITCGYGNIGSPLSEGYKAVQQDGSLTYAAMLAADFDADAHYVCYSGKGITVNVNGDTEDTLPTLFDYGSYLKKEKWHHDAWTPQLVVINAGTNDGFGGASPAQMTAGAAAFIRQVRSAYPDSAILWCYGQMDTRLTQALKEAAEQAGGSQQRICFQALSKAGKGELGAVGHPNTKGHRKAADELKPVIAKMTGWKEK